MPDVILDDAKARRVAANLNLKYTGSLGVLLKAKRLGIIESVREVLSKLKNANFRISSDLEAEVLAVAKE